MKPLDLLDDSTKQDKGSDLAELVKTRRPTQPKTAVKATANPLNAKNISKTAKNQKDRPRVFSSTPSLRQMMAEYNGRSTTLKPIKPHPAAVATVRDPSEFSSDQVDYLEVPGVSARVLRPIKEP